MNTVLIDHAPGTASGFRRDCAPDGQPAPEAPACPLVHDASTPRGVAIADPTEAATACQPPGPPASSANDAVETYTRTVVPLMGRLVGVARRILGDDAQAWDAVQEALIRLWNAGAIPPNPRAWLTRAVVLRSLHLARTRARRRRHEVKACDQRPEASDRDDPARRLDYEELSRALDEVLRSVPPDHRDVILLRTAAHMDYASIAETLQIPIGTVRSKLNRTRQFCREVLSRHALCEEEHGRHHPSRR